MAGIYAASISWVRRPFCSKAPSMHPVWKVKVYNKMNKCDLQRIVERA